MEGAAMALAEQYVYNLISEGMRFEFFNSYDIIAEEYAFR
jgi:hypothetical protein